MPQYYTIYIMYNSTVHRGWAHSLLHERLDKAFEVLGVDVFAERVLERVDGLVQFLLVRRFLKLKNKQRRSDLSVPTTLILINQLTSSKWFNCYALLCHYMNYLSLSRIKCLCSLKSYSIHNYNFTSQFVVIKLNFIDKIIWHIWLNLMMICRSNEVFQN